MTTCVIGDIHGCAASLEALLALVDARADTLVFLGDYIDRGPHTRGVIDQLLLLKHSHDRVITLMGNHELMLLNYLSGREQTMFLAYGGKQTLASYGIPSTLAAGAVSQLLPDDHTTFFYNLPLLWEDEHAIYVHAGLQPGRPLSMQSADYCLWVREEFIRSTYNFGKKVIFGHTVFDSPLVMDNKIGIDTGAVYGGHLTALLLPEMEFVQVPGEQRNLSFA